MKYAGMPMGMWVLFGGSFRKHLSSVYGYDPETAKAIAAVSEFVREYTLASGGPYCDCGYKKKTYTKTEKCHDQKRADQKRL